MPRNSIQKVTSAMKGNEVSSTLDIVSALNDLEIKKSSGDSMDIYELVFNKKNNVTHTGSRGPSVANDTYVTLAYLMGKNAFMEAMGGKFILERIDKLQANVPELIRINEMRNGLYAVTVKRAYFEEIRQYNLATTSAQGGIEYFIELKLLTKPFSRSIIPSSVDVTRYLCFKIPVNLVASSALDPQAKKLGLKQTEFLLTSTTEMNRDPQHSDTSFSMNFFNSIVLITILSVVLILVGLGCFVVSLTLYVLSKFRSKKSKNDEITKKFSGEDSSEKSHQKNIFNSSQLIETDLNSESGIASGSQTRSTSSSSSSSSSASSLMHQSLNESISNNKKHDGTKGHDGQTIMVYDVMPSEQMRLDNQQQPDINLSQVAAKCKPNLMDRIYRKTNEMFLSKEKMCEQQIYSISTSECGSYDKHAGSQNLSSNNISPVTTTTVTSSIDSLIKKQQKGNFY